MREITEKELIELWNKNLSRVMVYIHSPFCKSYCNYCVYKGNIDTTDFDRYYKEYLPKQIDFYKEFIGDGYLTDRIYYGGGTININGSLDHMYPIFEQVNSYENKIDEKVIELHTGFKITEDQIKRLSEYKFTTIILCIQSLDQNVLRSKNRVCDETTIENIKQAIEWIHKYNMHCGIDLMAWKDVDLNITINDIKTIASLNPDEITVACDYNNKEDIDVESIKKSMEIKGYHWLSNQEQVKCLRIMKDNSPDWLYGFIPYLEEGDAYTNLVGCLGIGSYKNPSYWTYSNINRKYTIIEKNIDFTPHYYLVKEVSFWDKCRNIIDWLETCSFDNNAPIGSKLTFEFKNINDIDINNNFKDKPIEFNFESPNKQYMKVVKNLSKNFESIDEWMCEPRT